MKRIRCRKKNFLYRLTEKYFAYDSFSTKYFAHFSAHGPIKCDHLRFWRVSDAKLETDVVSDVKNGSLIEKSDYFRADCSAKDGSDWQNLFASIVPIPAAIQRARAAEKLATATGLNVYFLGFDSLSSLTFQRKLTKSYKFLSEELEAIVLEGEKRASSDFCSAL